MILKYVCLHWGRINRCRFSGLKGDVLILLAKSDISQGEELTISYCSPLLSTRERNRKLERTKGFRCRCRRCKDPGEFGSELGSLHCTKCAGGTMRDEGSRGFVCVRCGFAAAEEKAEAVLRAAAEAHRKVREGCEDPSRWERLLQSHARRLPQTNSLMLDLKNDLCALYARRGRGEALDRRLQIVEERARVLRTVDGHQSRLMGFLAFRIYLLLAEKTSRDEDTDRENGQRMRQELEIAASLLLEDTGCPRELAKLTKK